MFMVSAPILWWLTLCVLSSPHMATVESPILTLGVVGSADSVVLEPTCLLVFLDETGDELFSDPRHPVFGLGGCAILVADYDQLVRTPWRQMKSRHFGGSDAPLYANELSAPSTEQLKALGDFFATGRFARLAAVASGRTEFPDGYPPYQLVSRTLCARIERIASHLTFSRIALLMESSERANILAEHFIGPYNKVQVEQHGHIVELPIDHYFVPKALNEVGMEIADFIVQAVGGQARSQLINLTTAFRKDFASIFHNVPREMVEYVNVHRVAINDT